MALILGTGLGSAAGLSLAIRPAEEGGQGWRVGSEGREGYTHRLEASEDLRGWTEVAVAHEGPWEFSDPASTAEGRRFYRVVARPRVTTDLGKNLIRFADEPFLSAWQTQEAPRWVKFVILFSDPNRVWFQHSGKYVFHYDYAREHHAEFRGMSREQFDAATLRREGQLAVLGAVLVPMTPGLREVGIQFVGLEAYSPEQVAAWYHLVRSAVGSEGPVQAYYMPVPEQQAVAEANKAYLAQRGVTLGRVERWLMGDVCYAPGWAMGRLNFVTAAEIGLAYLQGRLLPTDILLTDGVPAEVPYLAGIVTLAPATPNAHVAILARSYGVPMVYPYTEEQQKRAMELAGKDVLVRLDQRFGACGFLIEPLPAELDPAMREEILELKAPGTVRLTPKAHRGAISADADGLQLSDVQYYGGKAAHYGLLRRVIPNHAPPAVAFSFDLWDAFLDQTIASRGRTLRAEIERLTAGFTYPPDLRAVRLVLDDVRDLIRDEARFTSAQQAEVLAALMRFTPERKIRFRSSTNVEDSEQFTGAGLYDSYSGCLADDVDADGVGPSQCDPEEAQERGVFRAMQRVYASFYNDNAWLERLRYGIDESQVGMAILAHYSYPDPDEMANGVATVQFRRSGTFRSYDGELVTQWGAESVTNPSGSNLPEVVGLSRYSTVSYLNVRSFSTLVPWGAYVMTWPKDYDNLAAQLMKVMEAYALLVPGRTEFTLDFEYKKMQPGDLVVKQVREVPKPAPTPATIPYLINVPMQYEVHQGEGNDVFAKHRSKSRLATQVQNLRLDAAKLTGMVHTNATFEHLEVEGGRVLQLEGGPVGWPAFKAVMDGVTARESWVSGSGAGQRTFLLETQLRVRTEVGEVPVFVPGDFPTWLRVQYASPVSVHRGDGVVEWVKEETVALVAPQPVNSRSLLQHREAKTKSGVQIQTQFYWPENPTGPTAGYTAPLIAWVETRIAGLTAEPLVLRGFYSQTYHPWHHNFAEEFLFEPRLDAGVSAGQLEELRVKNVWRVHVGLGMGAEGKVYRQGLDGGFRRVE